MRWKQPKDGAERTREAFAWLPVRCIDGLTRWLEFVEVDEVFFATPDGNGWWIREEIRPVAPEV